MSNSKQKLRGLLLGLMCLSFVLPQPDMIYGAQGKHRGRPAYSYTGSPHAGLLPGS